MSRSLSLSLSLSLFLPFPLSKKKKVKSHIPYLSSTELIGSSGPKCMHKAGVPSLTGGNEVQISHKPHVAFLQHLQCGLAFFTRLSQNFPPTPHSAPAFWISFLPDVFTCVLSAWNKHSVPSPGWFFLQVSSYLSLPPRKSLLPTACSILLCTPTIIIFSSK